MFEGSFVAIVTPFKDDGSLDEEKLQELIEFQIENGTHGIVPCGTTGESPNLTLNEKLRLFAEVKAAIGDGVVLVNKQGGNIGNGDYITTASGSGGYG